MESIIADFQRPICFRIRLRFERDVVEGLLYDSDPVQIALVFSGVWDFSPPGILK